MPTKLQISLIKFGFSWHSEYKQYPRFFLLLDQMLGCIGVHLFSGSFAFLFTIGVQDRIPDCGLEISPPHFLDYHPGLSFEIDLWIINRFTEIIIILS